MINLDKLFDEYRSSVDIIDYIALGTIFHDVISKYQRGACAIYMPNLDGWSNNFSYIERHYNILKPSITLTDPTINDDQVRIDALSLLGSFIYTHMGERWVYSQ